jgi:monoamine oxidase
LYRYTAAGEAMEGAACIVTVPLGCLKKGDIMFDPPLSDAKSGAIERLGFGHLNKVVMEFKAPFWDSSVDYFGAAHEDGDDKGEGRGRMFMFWNLEGAVGAPVLTALMAGAAAEAAEEEPEASLVASAMGVLRRISAAVKEKSAKDVAAAAASADDDAIDGRDLSLADNLPRV